MKLIRVDENAEQRALKELKKVTGLSDIETFISLYNQNMYQSNNDKIKSLLDTIQDCYRNIDTSKKYITIMSEEEIAIVSIQQLLQEWKFIASLKSLAVQMKSEGSEDFERIIFAKSKGCYPHIVDPSDNSQLQRHWSGKSLANDFDSEIRDNSFLGNLVEDYSGDGSYTTVAYEIGKVVNIDDSFILKMRDHLVESAKQG